MLPILIPLMLALAPAALVADDDARCSGGICDTINRLCRNCIPHADAAAPDARCASEICEAVNRVCRKHFDVDCVA